jgi:hypothetical protein
LGWQKFFYARLNHSVPSFFGNNVLSTPWSYLLLVEDITLLRFVYRDPAFSCHLSFTCYLQIILSQEKNIQQLNQLIESLQRQLLHCRGSNNTVHSTTIAATEVSEVEGHEIIDDDNL